MLIDPNPAVAFERLRRESPDGFAFEEFAFQVCTLPEPGWKRHKLRPPDGGLDWYDRGPDGLHGHQAKGIQDVSSALARMRESLERALAHWPGLKSVTFHAPLDRSEKQAKRVEAAFVRWQAEIEGAGEVELDLVDWPELARRVGRDGDAGRRLYWFNERVLGSDWAYTQMTIARDYAGPRYTPEHHVELGFRQRFEALRVAGPYADGLQDALRALRLIRPYFPPGGPDTLAESIERLSVALGRVEALRPAVAVSPLVAGELAELAEAVDDARSLTQEVWSTAWRWVEDTVGMDLDDPVRREMVRCGQAARDIERELTVTGTWLAPVLRQLLVGRVYLLHGEAGMGKTHALLDALDAGLSNGYPGVVVFAERLEVSRLWSSLAEQFGLPPLDADALLGACNAAGEAARARFILGVDALDEADDPAEWRGALLELAARIEPFPFVALAITCRTEYLPIVLGPDGHPAPWVVLPHFGFVGHEEEAVLEYLGSKAGLAPDAVLLAPDVAEPLTLKLFADIVAIDGSIDPVNLLESRKALFRALVEHKAARLALRLNLIPDGSDVVDAVGAFAASLVASGENALPEATAREVVNSFAPGRSAWTDTLFHSLLSEGLLVRYIGTDDARWVRFPFRAFSDHLVVQAALDRYPIDRGDVHALAAWSSGQGSGVLSAAMSAVAEEVEIELLDELPPGVDALESEMRLQAFLDSVRHRAPAAVGERAVALVEGLLCAPGEGHDFVQTALALAGRAGHPLSAGWLHRILATIPMADRDVVWGRPLFGLDEGPEVCALIRWAEREAGMSAPETAASVGLALLWLTPSPALHLRSHAVTALAHLLAVQPGAAGDVLDAALDVDDPRVVEAGLRAAYGAVLRRGNVDPLLACVVLARLSAEVVASLPLDIAVRDSARGILQWAAVHGFLEDATLIDLAGPPYGAPPIEIPSSQELHSRYGEEALDPLQSPDWRSLSNGLFGHLADFRSYEMSISLSRCHFREGFEGPVSEEALPRLVFATAAQMGWSPERFAVIDEDLRDGPARDRGGLASERFGLEYQRMAWRRVLTQVVDSAVAMDERGDPLDRPPWSAEMSIRTADPSLSWNDSDSGIEPWLATDTGGEPWWPPDPDLEEPLLGGEWMEDISAFPALNSLLRVEHEGAVWSVVSAYVDWSQGANSSGRHQIIALTSALVPRSRAPGMEKELESCALVTVVRPTGVVNGAYVGELHWAPWVRVDEDRHFGFVDEAGGIPVLPVEWLVTWERRAHVASEHLEASFPVPAPPVLQEAGLTWDGAGLRWLAGNEVAVRVHILPKPFHDHTVMLMEESWLDSFLDASGLVLVTGLWGERALLTDPDRRLTVVSHAYRSGGTLEFASTRSEVEGGR